MKETNISQDLVKVWIVEDDLVIGKDLELSLKKLGYDAAPAMVSGEIFLKKLASESPDLVLLDINLAGTLDGIDLGGKLKSQVNIPFIYLTALTDERTLERAKITEPASYLSKPFKMQDVQQAIQLALYKSEQQEQKQDTEKPTSEAIFVKMNNRLEKLKISEVLWIEAKDMYATIQTIKGGFVVSHSLKDLEKKFDNENFMRIHRSFIVALNQIEAIEDNNLLIQNQFIPIGKTYKDLLLKKLQIL